MHKSGIRFDLSVLPTIVQTDRDRFSLKTLEERDLRRIAKGRICVTVDQPRTVITIDSEVLDYVVQLKGVIDEIDAGNHETFTVSGDYYSNNIRFSYDPVSSRIEVYDVNGGEFRIVLPYREFRTSLLSFYKRALSDLERLYPELKANTTYRSMV